MASYRFEPSVCKYEAENHYSLEMHIERGNAQRSAGSDLENPAYQLKICLAVKDPQGNILSSDDMYKMQMNGTDQCLNALKAKFSEVYEKLREKGFGLDESSPVMFGMHLFTLRSSDQVKKMKDAGVYSGIPEWYFVKGSQWFERTEEHFARILTGTGFVEPPLESQPWR